ncbi:RNA-binding protein 28 [Bacillus rossius redtenbacheri]|uniref:RNA-binding protein 28 n=1 Tax=Bacillus rossius redtenbacheri TaxID=93214 RepID=UPI002FDDB5B4
MTSRKKQNKTNGSGKAKSGDKTIKNKLKRRDKRGRILVKNLPFKATEADVRRLFSRFGKVSEVRLPRRDDGSPVGCGFVQFPGRDKAARAIAGLSGTEFMGRTLDVSLALSKLTYIIARPDGVPAPGTTTAPGDEEGGSDDAGQVKEELEEVVVKEEPVDEVAEQVGGQKKKEKPVQKRGRLIVRNLPFKVTEANFKEHFEQFGQVHEVKLLRRPDGKLVGCGFVQFTWKQNAAKAILKTSGKPFMGRTIIVDWAVPKKVFTAQTQQGEGAEVKSEPEDEATAVKEDPDDDDDDVDADERKLDAKKRRVSSSEESGPSESEDELEDDGGEEGSPEDDEGSSGARPRVTSDDVAEGRTVFLKNIPFSATNENLRECVEQFGEVIYALVCIDPLTEHSKGTGFVKFKGKESAERCLSAGGQLSLGSQQLQVLPALPRQEIQDRAHGRKEATRNHDSRNLYLVKEGVVLAGSAAAAGVSAADMARRLQLEQWKTQMLRNLNMFVSRTRLVAHNLPSSWDDAGLRGLFSQHAPPGAVIKEARVMRDLRDVDAQGVGRSKEYGFVTFESHEAALQALRSINNNPRIFTAAKRPIVSFSIENKAILNLRQRRLAKSRDRNPLAAGRERPGPERAPRQGGPETEAEAEAFAGVAAQPGRVKMRSRFNLRTQAAVHGETLRREKRRRKDERRAAQARQASRKAPAALPVRQKKGKLKGEQKAEEVFNQLVEKYKRNLSSASVMKKWYE